ncbi:MAG TPA: AI-2E family transporter [Polyangia bacterium]|nr:AI-2E family transporter [Polyangia bacterium]
MDHKRRSAPPAAVPTAELPAPNREVAPSQVTLKTVFSVSFAVLLVVSLVWALVHSVVAIALTGAAILFAVALDHGVAWLVRHRLRRDLAIAVVALAALGLVVGLAFTLIPPAVDQGKALVQQAPSLVRTARQSRLFVRLDQQYHLAKRIEQAEKELPKMLEGAASPILAALGGLISLAGAAVTIFVLTVFMLIFGGRVIRAALAEARAERRPVYENVLRKIYKSIGGYLSGLTLICTINATLTTIFLAINRVPFFLPLGILSGASSTIPYAGPFVTGTFISLLTLVTQGVWHGLACGIYFVLYGQLEGNVLSPLIFRRTVHVNPLVVTVSVLFLGEMAGIVGAIVAVPVVAALQIIGREILRERREQLNLQHMQIAKQADGSQLHDSQHV